MDLHLLGETRTKVSGLRWAARNLATDLRYGASLAATIESRHRDKGAANVTNSQYSVLPHIFAQRIGPDGVLVDVGCGKGRVINWWLSQGFRNRMVGIELDADVASATAARLRRFPNVTIVNQDATAWMPDDATIAYLYSPFSASVMERFKAHLVDRFGERGITLLYWNPQYVEVFLNDPSWTTRLVELTDVADPRIAGSHGWYAVIQRAA